MKSLEEIILGLVTEVARLQKRIETMNGNHELAKLALQHVIDKQRERIQELEKSMKVIKGAADEFANELWREDAEQLDIITKETEKYV